jgi:hypothetical protein
VVEVVIIHLEQENPAGQPAEVVVVLVMGAVEVVLPEWLRLLV